MLTGELRSQVDAIWNAFWSGGIANPIEVIEQITYLLFQRRLDDLHTLEENKAIRLGKPIERRVYPPGADAKGKYVFGVPAAEPSDLHVYVDLDGIHTIAEFTGRA